MEIVKKKRGRKPKNASIDEAIIVEKKKRGRKKKYEIENFDKITNRDKINNFNHNIVYSDDEEVVENDNIKKVSFGNLNIIVSKKPINEQQQENTFKNLLKNTTQVINENELESEDEQEIPMENIIKMYKENKKYVTDFSETIKDQVIKRLRVVSCCKGAIPEKSDWPDKTDVYCWWCCHPFDTSPCTLPVKHDSLRNRFTFTGIFCSWNCTKAYNFEMNDNRKYERSSLITFLIQQLYGITEAIHIKPAPLRQCLKMFGGYMSIEDFRNNHKTVDSYHINLIKHNFIYPEVTEVTNVKLESEKKNLRLSRR